jgi:hypothetical protein
MGIGSRSAAGYQPPPRGAPAAIQAAARVAAAARAARTVERRDVRNVVMGLSSRWAVPGIQSEFRHA